LKLCAKVAEARAGRSNVAVFSEGTTDTYGSLLDSSNQLIASDDDSGENFNFSISRELNAGEYYIRVRGYSSNVTGAYELETVVDNGNSSGGLIWYNTSTGETAHWTIVGTSVDNIITTTGISDTRFELKSLGDFNGDGNTDLFWRAPNVGVGQNRIWAMNGSVKISGSTIKGISSEWDMPGTGDFDGDGYSDLLWRRGQNPQGQNRVWLMNEYTVKSGSGIPSLIGSEWIASGIGDFDGDGLSDIMWRNTELPRNRIWLMDGFTPKERNAIPNLSNDWEMVGTGDFDGDGNSDLLWRNESKGQNRIWLMNGLAVSERSAINNLGPSSWKLGAIEDFDSDGKDDIVWRNISTGQNRIWLMDGVTRKQGASFTSELDLNWTIIGAGTTVQ